MTTISAAIEKSRGSATILSKTAQATLRDAQLARADIYAAPNARARKTAEKRFAMKAQELFTVINVEDMLYGATPSV